VIRLHASEQWLAPDVMVVTENPGTSDDLLRMSAAVGLSARVVPDIPSAIPWWNSAALILLDHVALQQALELCLPARPRVIVVSRTPDSTLWQRSMELGARTVVSLPDGEEWLLATLGHIAGQGSSRAPIVTVVGARGGAGASTLAVALARVAVAESLSCYLIDVDPLGCGVHVYLGADDLTGVGWGDLRGAVGRIPPEVLRQGLPVVAGIRILSWLDDAADLPPVGVIGSILAAASADADVVVVDLPRWLAVQHEDDAAAVEVFTRTDRLLMVCPADVRSAMAAQRLLGHGPLRLMNVGMVVRGPAPGGVTGLDIAAAVGAPLAAEMAAEAGLDRQLEDGLPPGKPRRSPLLSTARQLLRSLAEDAVVRR